MSRPQSIAPATKTAPQGLQSASPATNSSGPQSTAPAMKSAHHVSLHAALPRQLVQRALPKTTSGCQNAAFAQDVLRFLKTSHMSKSHDSLHLPRNQTTPMTTIMFSLSTAQCTALATTTTSNHWRLVLRSKPSQIGPNRIKLI